MTRRRFAVHFCDAQKTEREAANVHLNEYGAIIPIKNRPASSKQWRRQTFACQQIDNWCCVYNSERKVIRRIEELRKKKIEAIPPSFRRLYYHETRLLVTERRKEAGKKKGVLIAK